MGFDLSGENPRSEAGEYFRNNVWWWRPLLQYIAITCGDVFEEEEVVKLSYNDGYLVTEDKANMIAEILKRKLVTGDVKKYEIDRVKRLAEAPEKVPCVYCDVRFNGMSESEKCFICKGTGMMDNHEKDYSFDERNVKKFVEFCSESGGFRVY